MCLEFIAIILFLTFLKNLKQIERNGENVSERVMEFFNRRTVLILNLLLGTFETVITSFESLNSFESHNLF